MEIPGNQWYNEKAGLIENMGKNSMNHTEDYGFFRQYMTEDEYVLWTGKPEKGNLITAREWMMLPFCLIWLSFSLFWQLKIFPMWHRHRMRLP